MENITFSGQNSKANYIIISQVQEWSLSLKQGTALAQSSDVAAALSISGKFC